MDSKETINGIPSEESSKTEPEKPTLPEFPEEAKTGLVKKYIDLVGLSTEAPDAYHWVVFLTIVGLLFGRRLFVSQPKPLYPNFYSLLIGPTGLSRKSTAMRIGIEDVLQKIDKDIAFSSGAVSSEAIYEILARQEGQRLLLSYDEARALLQISKRQGTSDILPKLNSLYNCPLSDSIDRRKNSTQVTRPFVSLIAASPIEWLITAIAQEDVMGGFLNRFLLVSGETKEPIPFAKLPKPADWERFVGELRDKIGQYIQSQTSEMPWSSEARDLFEEFYVPWHHRQRSLPGEIAALTNRIPDHIVKIAMLLSALAGETLITAEPTAIAVAIGRYLEQVAHVLFGDIGLTKQGRVERMIITRLDNNDRAMGLRHLRLAIGGKVDAEAFNRAISSLQTAGVLRVVSIDGKKVVILVGS